MVALLGKRTVALRIAVGHLDLVDALDDLVQQPRLVDHESGPLHVLGKDAARLADGLHLIEGGQQPRGILRRDLLGRPDVHPLRKYLVQGGRVELHETAPAQLLLAGSVDRVGQRGAHQIRLLFLGNLPLVQPPQEQQVGELLDNGEGVGESAVGEVVPDGIYLGF